MVSKEVRNRQMRAATKRKYLHRANWLNEQKNGPCSDCGNKYPSVAMQFDHVRGLKVAGISKLLASKSRATTPKLLAELEKCDLVCANCHFIREWHRNLYVAGVFPED